MKCPECEKIMDILPESIEGSVEKRYHCGDCILDVIYWRHASEVKPEDK